MRSSPSSVRSPLRSVRRSREGRRASIRLRLLWSTPKRMTIICAPDTISIAEIGKTTMAIALLEKSAGIDPLFAAAQARLAFAYGTRSFFFSAADPQWEDRAFAAIQKAEALDIESPEVHYARSAVLWSHSHAFPHRDALAEARKAYSIQPSFDEAWHLHAVILFHIGHIQEAWREIEK